MSHILSAIFREATKSTSNRPINVKNFRLLSTQFAKSRTNCREEFFQRNASKLGVLGLIISTLGISNVCYAEEQAPAEPFENPKRMVLQRQTTHGIQGGARKSHYDFVIVGVGTTVEAAIEGILQIRPDADILVLSKYAQLPRMDLWRKKPLQEDLVQTYNEWRRHVMPKLEDSHDSSMTHPLTMLICKDDFSIDIENRQLILGGDKIYFDKALLAMPGVPRDLYVLASLSELHNCSKTDRVNALQEIADFEAIETIFGEDQFDTPIKNVTIVGGGFLGTELALALAKRGKESGAQITQLYAEKYPLQTYLPVYLCKFLRKKMKQQLGIDHVTERLVTNIGGDENSEGLNLSLMGLEQAELKTDYVVLASTHVVPQAEVARKSGFEVDPATGGVMVNSQLEAAAGIYAAGSCASFYDPVLGRRRVDRFDHSINSGFLAGMNMALTSSTIFSSEIEKARSKPKFRKMAQNPYPGNQRVYSHQPAFKSNLKDIGVEIDVIGDIHSDMKTIGLWVEKDSDLATEANFKRGIVYYLKDQQIQGILLWNASDVLDRARSIIRKQPDINLYDVKQLKRQIPIAPDSWLKIHETN